MRHTVIVRCRQEFFVTGFAGRSSWMERLLKKHHYHANKLPKSMKTPFIIVTLLVTPFLAWAEETPVPVTPSPPAPAATAAAADSAPAGLRAAAVRQHVLEKFDSDKDGKLSDNERDAAKTARKQRSGDLRAKALEKFDSDKDGLLSETEREALKTALKARRDRKGGGAEKDGVRNAERHRKMLEKFDEDKDGQLNESERAKAREARKARPGATP